MFSRIEQWVAPVPEPLLGLAVLALAAVFVGATLRDRRRPPTTPTEPNGDHHEHDDAAVAEHSPDATEATHSCHAPSGATTGPDRQHDHH